MTENEDIFVRLDTLCVVDGNRQNTIKKNERTPLRVVGRLIAQHPFQTPNFNWNGDKTYKTRQNWSKNEI